MNTIYCFCFAMKTFCSLISLPSFSKKLSRLPVTLPILTHMIANIHRKTFAVMKQSAKKVKLFHCEIKANLVIEKITRIPKIVYFYAVAMLILLLNNICFHTKFYDHSSLLRITFSSLTVSAANLRIPSASFSVAIWSSFSSHLNCFSLSDIFSMSSAFAIIK